MRLINLIPGSTEWQTARSASKAAAMMGLSSYQTRSELLRQMATGIAPEIDAHTQARFDNGHRTEALARAIVEDRIGEGLSPVSAATDDGYLTANYDGLTFCGDVGFEHKDWNEKLAAAVMAGILPMSHVWQLEQQLLVGGLDKIIFVCSNGTREKFVSMEYRAVPGRAAQLWAGWAQFDADLTAYVSSEVILAAVAVPTMALPALSIQVNGSITLIDNLALFGGKLNSFIDGLNKTPDDDQGFADAESAIKTLQAAQDALEAAESSALAQTSSIDEMRRTVAMYASQAKTTRLMLEKMVKARKESIRIEMVQAGKAALSAHIEALNARLGKPYMPTIAADFAGVIKSKRTISSLRDAVDGELSRCKMESSAIADKIEMNLRSLRELAANHAFLFSDAAQIVMKANDDLVMLIKSRMADHDADEAKRLDAEREIIRKEEESKAEVKARAKAAALVESHRVEFESNQKLIDAADKTATLVPDTESVSMASDYAKSDVTVIRCQIAEALFGWSESDLLDLLEYVDMINSKRLKGNDK